MNSSTRNRSFSGLGIVSYIIASLFLLYEMAVQVSPSVMVPQLMSELHINSATLGFMASTYFWSYTIMQVPVGLLFDRFPAKNLLLIAILLATLGILFFATTHWVSTLALGRFLMGLGSAFAFVGVLMIAARWFSRTHFAFLVGIAQMLGAVGAASGEGPLSLLVNAEGWRHTALILSGVGFVLFLAVVIFMRRHPSEGTAKKDLNWSKVWHSLRQVLSLKQMWWIALYAFFSWGPITIFTSMWGVPYLMQRFGVSNTEASLVCAMTWGFLAITSPLIGRLSSRISPLLLMQWTALAGLVGGAAILYWPGLSLWGAYVAAAGIGVGASGQILAFEVVRQQRLQDDLGFSISFTNMGVVASGATLQPLSAWLLHSRAGAHISSAIEQFHTADFQYALFLVPLIFVFCYALARYVIKEPKVC